MSYIIQHVTVEGLWGVKSFDTDFHTDINILIGQNGSNKTTFLSLIEASLLVDIRTLQQFDFRKVNFTLCDDKDNTVFMFVERIADEDWIVLRYHIPGEDPIDIRVMEEYDDRYYRGYGPVKEKINHMRNLLSSLVKMTWLSVDRYTEMMDDRRPYRSVVDQKLAILLRELTVYRLRLLEQTNKLTKELNSEALTLLLYDDSTDNIEHNRFGEFSELDPKEIKSNLYRVFYQMCDMSLIRDKVQTHLSKITDAVEMVKSGKPLQINDIAPLILVNRTLSIVEKSKKYKEDIDRIMEPIDTYQRILKKFIKDKEFNFSEERGSLKMSWVRKIAVGDIHTILDPQNLSSGEKQLLILLTQTLLQEKKPFVFIADEPELSLHIEWQKNIIRAINEINPNAQVIVATHSPEIAGGWAQKIIAMESITKYEK